MGQRKFKTERIQDTEGLKQRISSTEQIYDREDQRLRGFRAEKMQNR